jgi:16S rRNA G1207 methylase RsmC
MGSDHYFSGAPEGPLNPRRIRVELAGRTVEVSTAGGVFSPDRLDAGTAVLLTNSPPPPAGGDILDLGCGWGPLALPMALLSPGATVWAVDVNARALDLVRRNAESLGLRNVRPVTPDEVPDDVRFAALWSNPPIRVGKDVLHGMLLRWLPRLDERSDAWLVVQRNLGADSLQRWLESSLRPGFGVHRAATGRGYRVIKVRRHAQAAPGAAVG